MNKLPISFETILLFITLTGLLFVPESRIPLLVWPLIAGTGNLAYVALRTVQNHTFRDEDFGPFMAAVFFLALAIGMLYDQKRSGVSFLIALIALLIAGILWAVWKASKPSPN